MDRTGFSADQSLDESLLLSDSPSSIIYEPAMKAQRISALCATVRMQDSAASNRLHPEREDSGERESISDVSISSSSRLRLLEAQLVLQTMQMQAAATQYQIEKLKAQSSSNSSKSNGSRGRPKANEPKSPSDSARSNPMLNSPGALKEFSNIIREDEVFFSPLSEKSVVQA